MMSRHEFCAQKGCAVTMGGNVLKSATVGPDLKKFVFLKLFFNKFYFRASGLTADRP